MLYYGQVYMDILYILICLALTYVISEFYVTFNTLSVFIVSFPFLILLLMKWGVWRFATFPDRDRAKKKIRMFTVGGVIPFFLLLTLLGVNDKNSKFNAERWAKDEENRGRMAEHLLEEHNLVGKTREDIVGLLGEEDYYEEGTNNEMIYYLGTSPKSFIPVDTAILVISFNENNKVIKCNVQVS